MRPTIGFALVALLLGQPATAQEWGQPPEERAAQAQLPQSPDALWKTLATTKIGEDDAKGIFTAKHPAKVEALDGKTLTISGFMLPLDAESEKSSHFLLTRYTPVCPFCPPGAPNEVVEVWTTEEVEPTYDLISVRGNFKLEDNGEKGLFFQLADASMVVDLAPTVQ